MARWFWYFLIYSFFGYCLEKLFARAVHSDRQVRKCFLLLPLCPVYGLAMTAVLALTEPTFPFFVQAVIGGILCTAVEYLVHLIYDKAFRVRFWDYSDLNFHLSGRVCPHFACIWGVLSAFAVRFIHPAVAAAVTVLPPVLTFTVWIVFAADCLCTAVLLRRYRDTELLSLAALFSYRC